MSSAPRCVDPWVGSDPDFGPGSIGSWQLEGEHVDPKDDETLADLGVGHKACSSFRSRAEAERIVPNGDRAGTEWSCRSNGDGEAILAALYRNGYAYKVGCRRGGCGVCKVDLVEGEVSYPITVADTVLSDGRAGRGHLPELPGRARDRRGHRAAPGRPTALRRTPAIPPARRPPPIR